MKLADALKESKESYAEIARICGVHRETVRRWACINGKIPIQHAQAICDLLGVSLEAIYEEGGRYLPIDDDVPVPPPMRLGCPGRAKPIHYVPWARMKVGQSCFVPESLYHRSTVMVNAQRAGIRMGYKFCARTLIEGGVRGTRVWRAD